MSLHRRIRWSKQEYGMRQLVEKYAGSLPILCKTTLGIDGGDDEINQIGADEIYWIHGIQLQTRLLAQSDNGTQPPRSRYVSIPTDYALKLLVVGNNNKSEEPPISVDEAVAKLRRDGGEFKVMFDEDRRVAFNMNSTGGNIERFGVMKVVDVYDQKYLLANTVVLNDISQVTVGLPVYMEVMFVIAEGFQGINGNCDRDEFTRWFSSVRKIHETFERKPVKTFKDLIVFNECPSKSEYEYLRPQLQGLQKDNDYMSLQAYNKISTPSSTKMTTAADAESGQSVPPMSSPRRTTPSSNRVQDSSGTWKLNSVPDNGQHLYDEVAQSCPSVPPEYTARDRCCSSSASPSAGYDVRCTKTVLTSVRPEVVNPATATAASLAVGSWSSSCVRPPWATPPPPHPPASVDPRLQPPLVVSRPPAILPSTFVEHQPTAAGPPTTTNAADGDEPLQQLPPLPPPPRPSRRPLPTSKSCLNRAPAPNPGATQYGGAAGDGEIGNQRPKPSSSSLVTCTTAADVPVDVDVGRWTTGDVMRCLHLLCLDSHADRFDAADVDGRLLLDVEEPMFVEHFGLSAFEARKLTRFLHDGWRPAK